MMRKMPEQVYTVEDFIVSDNDKTDKSANFGLHTCRPTKMCRAICYARGRTQAEAEKLGFGSTVNRGPITWDLQQACYDRNVEVVKYFVESGRVHELAESIAKRCAKVEIDGEVKRYIRWNGCGDLFPEALVLIVALGEHDVRVWGFSRIADLIEELAVLADAVGLHGWGRPYFHGSIDKTTYAATARRLEKATERLNGAPVIAVAALDASEICPSPSIKVHFGYHTNLRKTRLGTDKECPATAGDHVVCKECLRCFGTWKSRATS